MSEYEELEKQINLAFCKNSTCYPTCSFPKRDCPQAKVVTREHLSIIAEKCWLKDERAGSLYNVAGFWRPVKELKQEAK